MPHLASLGLPLASIAHLLEVVLVILETSLRHMPVPPRHLLRLVDLSAHGQHAAPIVVVVLHVYLVIDVVHVLLL